jgi:chromate transporter
MKAKAGVDAAPPRFAEAVGMWLKIGLVSFGGPAGQIAIMHQELVERRRWVDEREFVTALNFCILPPGPETQQLATYLGLKPHGLRGALAAGVLFVLPGAVVLFALAWLAAEYQFDSGIG